MIKFFVRDEDLPEYLWLIRWGSGSITHINEWKQIRHFRRYNWMTFNLFHAEFEYGAYINRIMITLMLLGIGFRLTWILGSKEKREAYDKRTEELFNEWSTTDSFDEWDTPEEDEAWKDL